MRAHHLCIAALAALGLAMTGCESKAKEGTEAQAQAQIQAKAQEGIQAKSEVVLADQANTQGSLLRVRLEGGDLVAPIVFEASKGIAASTIGPLLFAMDTDVQVLSQDGKHTLKALGCQSPERKAGTYKGEDGLPVVCELFILSTTAPFKGQALPAGEGFEWNAVIDPSGTFELLAYAEKGSKHAKAGPKGSHGMFETKRSFDFQVELKVAE